MKKTILAALAALCLAVGTATAAAADTAYTTSKSKTAENLARQSDGSYTAEVTLSMPSAEQQLVSDVVFVLDKSTSATLQEQVLQMLQVLQAQIDEDGAKINVGVVVFNRTANVANDGSFYDLATQYAQIEAAIRQEVSGGTNAEAGLLAGKAMLDADTATAAARKYLIFVSDGITYIFDRDGTPTAINSIQPGNGENAVLAGPDCWGIRHYQDGGNLYVPADFGAYLDTVGQNLAQAAPYEQPYAAMNPDLYIPKGNTTTPTTVDVALYETRQVYQNAEAAGYRCYALTADAAAGADFPWGPAFMEYLADGKTVSFEYIQNDIYYLLGAGSYVIDTLGRGVDYTFALVNDAAYLTMQVGSETYAAEPTGENAYGFAKQVDGSYAYTLVYTPAADGGSFVWQMNVPVSDFARVQLTYTVRLVDPQTAPGTYGVYDRDGSRGESGLYTNASAVLHPIDSNETPGADETFAQPTVSYTVAATPTPTASPTAAPTAAPTATATPKPTAAPTARPTARPTATARPAATKRPAVPQTGDAFPAERLLALAAISAAALAVLRRRRKTR